MNRKAKILIVEDEEAVAMTMSFLLTRAGCITEMATTKAHALQLTEIQCFDLITLDLNMPDGDGFKFCARLKEVPQLRDTPIVIVSGRANPEDRQRGLEAGAADYIAKPFEAFQFAPRLLSHIKTEKEC